jgi:hypothetical protein
MLWRASSRSPAHHNDIYRFNRGTSTWTRIVTNGDVPPPRVRMGFTATPNGMIYLFGGYSDYSGELERWIEESTRKLRVHNKSAKPILNTLRDLDGHIFDTDDSSASRCVSYIGSVAPCWIGYYPSASLHPACYLVHGCPEALF